MTAYVDSSVLLRLLLGEKGGLVDLPTFDALVASELLVVEAHRTVDRMRVGRMLSAEAAVRVSGAVSAWTDAIDLVLLRSPVLTRASEPMATPLGTLDAIHLATALIWRERTASPLVFATHDLALAEAARAYRFDVIGV